MAIPVYYSISPFGTGDIKVPCDISIAGGAGVAAFSVAQTGNIGVGTHIISANIDGFISEMINATSVKIVTALGVAHVNVSSETLTSIAHEYASLSAFEAGFTDANHINDTDLTNANVIVNATCYFDHDDDTVDSTEVFISGQTVDATRYINLYTPQGGTESINNQRHNGKWSLNKYRLDLSSNTIVLQPDTAYTRIEGFQVRNTNTSNCKCIRSDAATAGRQVIKCITRGNPTATGEVGGINFFDAGATDTNVVNNVCYDHDTTGTGWAIFCRSADSGAPAIIYHNTVIDSDVGIRGRGGEVIAKNNISFGCTTAYVDSGFDNTNSINNAGDVGIGSIPGSNSVDVSGDAATDLFTDPTNDDFSIVGISSNLFDAGADLSSDSNFIVTDDIIDVERPQNLIYDIGAFEFIVILGLNLFKANIKILQSKKGVKIL